MHIISKIFETMDNKETHQSYIDSYNIVISSSLLVPFPDSLSDNTKLVQENLFKKIDFIRTNYH